MTRVVERRITWTIGFFVYAVVYCYGASLIPFNETSIPIQWVPILGGAVAASIVMYPVASFFMRHESASNRAREQGHARQSRRI